MRFLAIVLAVLVWGSVAFLCRMALDQSYRIRISATEEVEDKDYMFWFTFREIGAHGVWVFGLFHFINATGHGLSVMPF